MSDTLVSARGPIRAAACCALLWASAGALNAQTIPQPLCPILLHEERLMLEQLRLEVDLERSAFTAFEQIFKKTEELWKHDAVDRMTYVRDKYTRDAALLAFEHAELVARRQETLIEQYRTVCGVMASDEDDPDAGRAYLRYLETHCD